MSIAAISQYGPFHSEYINENKLNYIYHFKSIVTNTFNVRECYFKDFTLILTFYQFSHPTF